MYKLAYVSGSNQSLGPLLKNTLEDINNRGGKIAHMTQSQSTSPQGNTIVTVTIIYTPSQLGF
jgi:hypothetical protein